MHDFKALAAEMINEHRTIQQCFMREVIMPFLAAKAQDHAKKRFDLRNQSTCEVSARLWEKLQAEDFYLPYI